VHSTKARALGTSVGVALAIVAITSLFPFFWNLCSAFKPVSEIFTYPPSFVPKTFTLRILSGSRRTSHTSRRTFSTAYSSR
jgi:ABC-type glycerol-3-phosphate transport system permease component